MKSLKKKVVLLGFKGDCSGRFYNKILIQMALQGKIELSCVDFGKPKNVLKIPPQEEMEKLIKKNKVQYLNLENSNDIKKYNNLSNVDAVFIAVSNVNHAKCARDFLGKAKRIFIDKSLDASLRDVRLIENYPKVEKIIFGYDHYLAKFYPFQIQTNKWLNQEIVGKIKKIEFRLLETSPIPLHRIRSLDSGTIYDLFSHGLALITTIPSKLAYPDLKILKNLRLLNVEVAQYSRCPIKGCTFAKIDFEIPFNDEYIFCQSRVGKGVGKIPEKYLKVIGTKGEISVDIDKFKFSIFNSRKKIIGTGSLDPNYAKTFLSAAIDFRKVLRQIPGAMPLKVAKEILFILEEAEAKQEPSGNYSQYPLGSSVSEIESIIKRKRNRIDKLNL